MKTSKKIIAFGLILLMLTSFSGLFVFAVASPTVSLASSKESVKPGDSVVINFNLENFTATEIKSGTIEIEYDNDAFTYQMTNDANISVSANTIKLSLDNLAVADGKAKAGSLTFKAENVFGDMNFTIISTSLKDESGLPIDNVSNEDIVVSIQSNDAYLRALEVDEAQLNKPFSKDVYNYSISVKNSVTRINVAAIPNDKNANVTITGDESLKVGTNEVKIVVTAQDRLAKKTYIITVTRAGAASSSSSSSSSSRSSQGKTSVSIATYSRSESSSSQVSSTVPVKNNEEDTPIGLLLIVGILCTGFGGLGGYVIREQLYIRKK